VQAQDLAVELHAGDADRQIDDGREQFSVVNAQLRALAADMARVCAALNLPAAPQATPVRGKAVRAAAPAPAPALAPAPPTLVLAHRPADQAADLENGAGHDPYQEQAYGYEAPFEAPGAADPDTTSVDSRPLPLPPNTLTTPADFY